MLYTCFRCCMGFKGYKQALMHASQLLSQGQASSRVEVLTKIEWLVMICMCWELSIDCKQRVLLYSMHNAQVNTNVEEEVSH